MPGSSGALSLWIYVNWTIYCSPPPVSSRAPAIALVRLYHLLHQSSDMDRPWVLKQTTYTTKYVVATQQFTNSANSRHNRQFIRLQATTILLPDNSQLVNFQSPISIRTPTNTSYLFKCMLSTAQIYVPETTHTIAHTTAHCTNPTTLS